MQWKSDTHAYELPKDDRANFARVMGIVTRGGIDSLLIRVPVMFYVVIKEGRKFFLFLIRFNDEDGCFEIHQAGKEKEIAADDVATKEFFDRFDKFYIEVVASVLREVFRPKLSVDSTG